MMGLFPSSFFFVFFMVGGVFISISSSNWFLVWCGLEMNLMGFIPLIIQMKNLGEVEAAVKYFLVQSFGSALVLFGASISFSGLLSWGFSSSSVPIIAGLMVKLGVFPFYFWLPSVMLNMGWLPCTLVATWQKVAPFSVLASLFCSMSSVLVWFGVIGSIVGGLMGMNQVNLKSLLAYSSIGHMGWMLSVSQVSVSVSIVYLMLYLLSNFFVFFILTKMNFFWLSSMKSVGYKMQPYIVLFGVGFLTLGGIPPLVGFFVKLYSIEVIVESGLYVASLGLVVGTCFSLYYYVSLILSACSNYSFWNKSHWGSMSLGVAMFMLFLLNLVVVSLFLILM